MDEQESDEDLTAQINAALAAEAASCTPEQAAEDKALEAWLNEAGRRTWDAVEWTEWRSVGATSGGATPGRYWDLRPLDAGRSS